MGVVVNAVKDMATSLGEAGATAGQGVADGAGTVDRWTGTMNKLAGNAAYGLEQGSSKCPILSECRAVGEGVAWGDFGKAALSGGLLAFYALPVGGAAASAEAKIGITSAYLPLSSASKGILAAEAAALGMTT